MNGRGDSTNDIRLPRIKSIRDAVEIYYTMDSMNTADIMRLFGCCATKARDIKRPVQLAMKERRILPRTQGCVSTEVAYEIWGIDIQALERRFQKAEKFGFGG